MKEDSKYVFSLHGVNIDHVEQKYGIGFTTLLTEDQMMIEEIPENDEITKLDDLYTSSKPEIVSFMDESKLLRNCCLSHIKFDKKIKYKCYWDRNHIPHGWTPIGCPIKYITHSVVKKYCSEITKDNMVINENITNHRYNSLKEDNNDKRIQVQKKDYFETFGAFCSFNCCMAFIQSKEAKANPIFNNSTKLLLQLYNRVYKNKIQEIIPADHWMLLKEHGGHLCIEDFRKDFNKVYYNDFGMIGWKSVGFLFEKKMKF